MSKLAVYLYNFNKMYVTVILYSENKIILFLTVLVRQSGKVP